MEPTLFNSNSKLQYRHISEPTKEILKYINDRRFGVVKSLKTRWKKFNDQCMGGIEPNTIYSICGISGSGKSAFINSLENDLFDLNKDVDFVILSLNFEMISSKQIGRKLSYKLLKTTQELYSGIEGYRLSNENYKKATEVAEDLKNYQIYYVDTPGNTDQIRDVIQRFSNEEFVKNKWLIIMLDHTLLAKSNSGEGERETLFSIQRLFMEIKKYGRNTIIQLSQLNRSIQESERIQKPLLHFPTRADIFGSESLYQASDYVMVLHRPETLGITAYGVNSWPTKDRVYLHLIKAREGEPKILAFKNNLKYNSIEELDVDNTTINNKAEKITYDSNEMSLIKKAKNID